MGVGQAADAAAAGDVPDDRPPIKLGDICARLGFTVNRAFIETTLGITPSGTDKSAVLWPASAWEAICDALVDHINEKKGAF